jgi:DNA ligase (NAD+)
MIGKEIMNEIKNLESLILYHQNKYYNDEPELSDEEFDALWDKLQKIDPNNAIFTKEIGKDNSKSHGKVKHLIPMGSQQKASNMEDFKKWSKKNGNLFVVQYKCDGISVELQYENGNFVRAVSRGDGILGDDISIAVKLMKGCVLKIDSNFTGGIRGEILMPKKVFETKYKETAKNPRNMASGIAKRKDETGANDLCIKVYDAQSDSDLFSNECDKIAWLQKQKFDVVESQIMAIEEIESFRSGLIAKGREVLDFEIDGLVIKMNEIDREDMKRARPEKQIALKFPTQNAVSTLIDVEWRISGRNVTPVGQIHPVEIAGTTVKQASLSNVNKMNEMGLMIGSEVMVSKRGDIIPKIERVIHTPNNAKKIEIPTICNACNTKLINEGSSLYCPNPKCDNKLFGRLQTWITKLGVKNFGDSILLPLFQSGRVKTISEFYSLKVEDLTILDRVGEKAASKALKNLFEMKELDLPTFIAGFDIDGISRSTIKMIVENGFDTLEKIKNASVEQLSSCHGIGGITAHLIKDGVNELYEEMIKVLQFISIKKPIVMGSKFAGMSFCITGSLNHFKPRSKAEDLIVQNGGTIKSVGKGLTFLITNDTTSGSSKNEKAVKFGVKIISEEEFLKMLS